MIKYGILELKRKDKFDINYYIIYLKSSPATLLAKKQYCDSHGIKYKQAKSILYYSWKNLMKKVDPTINAIDASRYGKKVTKPLKKRYSSWMKAFKKFAKDFYKRHGRRVITRI